MLHRRNRLSGSVKQLHAVEYAAATDKSNGLNAGLADSESACIQSQFPVQK
jgi:hypothetical protein